MESITQLLDQRYELERQIEALSKQKDELTNDIVGMMLSEDIKEAEASNGLRFTTFASTRYDYKKPVYDYLDQIGLLSHFVPEPKVTKTKLDKLLKSGDISYQDMAKIEQWTVVEQSPYSLKKKAVKEVV